jgi:thiol-disulfide isomerase/thioredoxin
MNNILLFAIGLIIIASIVYFFNYTKKKTQINIKKVNNKKENYNNNVNDGKQIIVILCYADWCSHCPIIKEWYMDLVENSPFPDVIFKAFEEKEIPTEIINEIEGFPTILININNTMEKYNGSRTKESLLNYLENL